MKQLIFLPFTYNVMVPNRFFVTMVNPERAERNGDAITLIYGDGEKSGALT